MNNINEVINKIYNKKQTFTSKYGSDLVISLIIIYIFLILTTYYYIQNHIPIIKANWSTNKCNPLYLPFAGLIVNDKSKSKLNIVSENFEACVQNILTSITSEAVRPIYYVMNTMTGSFKEMSHATTAIRSFFNKIRVDMKNTSQNISGRTLNVTIPFTKQVIYLKDMLGKFIGLLTTTIYTLMGGYLTLNSLVGSIIEMVEIILGIVAGAIAAALFIPFIGELVAAPMIAFEVGILALFIPMVIAFNSIFNENKSMGSVADACFGKNTKIKMENNINKNISEIEIGDKLFDGSIVTAFMKISSYNQTIYNLNEIIVTGKHRIYHETFGWIKVEDHPLSYEIDDHRQNFVYCLNTNTKVIKIGELTFTDWDDLDDKDLYEINKSKNIFRHINNKDIHPYLDNGFGENTLIEMEIGSVTKIKDIEVNDILRFGERVLGVIKIDAIDINSINEYYINNSKIICSKNIQLYTDNLGDFNTNILEGNPVIIKDYLYQLITDKGTYYIGDIKVRDYNFAIEKYLTNINYNSENLHNYK